jgi:uncharacterized membrane protein (DUF2068 family)
MNRSREGTRMSSPESQPVGVHLIVLYKAIKAVAEVALSLVLVVLAATGELATLRELSIQLREHFASRWSLMAGRAMTALFSERGVHLLQIGLALDGVLSAFEGWSLWRGRRWGRWVVVIATATPLPLEVVEIARSHRPSRAFLALLNVAVVAYLARDLRRHEPSA